MSMINRRIALNGQFFATRTLTSLVPHHFRPSVLSAERARYGV